MDFAVIGAGNTGQIMAGHLALLGHRVRLYDRNQDKVTGINQSGIQLQNFLEGKVQVPATANMAECIAGVEFIMVMSTANGHADICRSMKPHLQNGQTIVVFNSNWGGAEFKHILGDIAKEKNITIAETAAMLYVGHLLGGGQVFVKQIKQETALSAMPADKGREVLERLQGVYPQLTLAGNLLETSLNNPNTMMHAPITLFNISRIELGQEFLFYKEGTSVRALSYIEKMDSERMAIAQRLGVQAQSTLDTINSFWPDKHDNLPDTILLNKSYQKTLAPKSLHHRYINEDIPYGLVPLVKLGRAVDVPTPYLSALVDMASLYLERDFIAEGPEVDFSNLKLADYM